MDPENLIEIAPSQRNLRLFKAFFIGGFKTTSDRSARSNIDDSVRSRFHVCGPSLLAGGSHQGLANRHQVPNR